MIKETTDAILVEDEFWTPRQRLNAEISVFHQWEQFEATGRLDNFRKAAGLLPGRHQGYFYNDSDVHKWAEAVACILGNSDDPALRNLLGEYVDLVVKAQETDGYLFSYNQLNFPRQRWLNLQIESELYTMGHFIEAGIAAHCHLGNQVLFGAARKTADLIVDRFLNAPHSETPGHQEVEIALMRLYHNTGESRYFQMAEQFLERRGTSHLFGLRLIGQFISHSSRAKEVAQLTEDQTGEKRLGFDVSENLSQHEPPFISLRANYQFLTGKYHQQHLPIRLMKEPVGHSVRWSYLQTATTMLYRESGDPTLLETLEESWDCMVREKMYVTGGVGSLPVVEGFGKPYELDNRFAYAETCAAIATIFWSHQMALATGEAKYADLIEWQLYNAAAVGIAQSGRAYLYRNPLTSDAELTRKPWFGTACCPGNVSRLWAQLDDYICSVNGRDLILNQYIGCKAELEMGGADSNIKLAINSTLPWNSSVTVSLSLAKDRDFCLKLRIPGWASGWQVSIDGEPVQSGKRPEKAQVGASSLDAFYLELDRTWSRHSIVEIQFDMPVVCHLPHPKVKSNRGKTALSRGPLVYCLEDIDNPQAGVPEAILDRKAPVKAVEPGDRHPGMTVLESADAQGSPLTFIPYYSWANREPSKMQVWVTTTG